MSLFIMQTKGRMDYSTTSTTIKLLGTIRYEKNVIHRNKALLYQTAVSMFVFLFCRNNHEKCHDNTAQMDFTTQGLLCLRGTS